MAGIATRRSGPAWVIPEEPLRVGAPSAVRLSEIVADDVAFRRWYDLHAPRVYAYLLSRCGSPSLTEELVQAVFVEVVRHPTSFDGRADTLPWLIGIARHRLARHFREQGRFVGRLGDGVVKPIEAPVADDARFAMAWRSAELQGRIRFALDALPPLQRAALILRFMDDLPVRDVARLLRRGENATESLIRRARERFERLFGKLDDAG